MIDADSNLLAAFVESFRMFDDLMELNPFPVELRDLSKASPSRWARWKPASIRTDAGALATVYKQVPGPFPPLFEQLVLSYRWLEVELAEIIRLLQNPPADSLMPLLNEITNDPIFVDVLLPEGSIPFGKAPGGCYDPIYFDTLRRGADGDCPIVRFEHEAILCDLKIGESLEVASSFRSLMEMIIAPAALMRNK